MTFSTDKDYQELPPNNDLKKRKEYWEVAKGLQKIDGLETSQYLESVISDTPEGKYGTFEAEGKISRYYEEVGSDSPKYSNRNTQ